MDKLKLLAMLLLTRPYPDDCKPYEMLKEMEQRCNDIVEKSFEAGYRQRDAELILKTVSDE